MKNIILIILLFLGLNMYSQGKTLTISDGMVEVVEDFISDAQDRGFYVRGYLMDHIDTINFYDKISDDPYLENLGLISGNYRSIYINKSLRNKPLLLKIAVYHEIGHSLNATPDHTCGNCVDIMSEYSLDDLTPIRDDWDGVLDRYFKWINEE